MPTPNENLRGFHVEHTGDGVILRFDLDHEIGARTFFLTDTEAGKVGRALVEIVIKSAQRKKMED